MSLTTKMEKRSREWAKGNLQGLRRRDVWMGGRTINMVAEGEDDEIIDKFISNFEKVLKEHPQADRALMASLGAQAFATTAEDYVSNIQSLYDILNIQDNPWEKFCKDHNLNDLKERYEIKGKIGSGTYGIVYKAYDKERKENVALKVLTFDDEITRGELHDIKGELRALERLSSRKTRCSLYISCLYDWYCVEKTKFVISMELIQGDTLFEYLPEISGEQQILEQIIRGLVLGVQDLQNANVIHMDLHAGNVLIDETGQVKIIDFGLSCFEGHICGVIQKAINWTPFKGRRPPEIVDNTIKSTIKAYKAADIWMLGVLIKFVSQKNPSKRLYQGLVEKMLSSKPIKRPTIGEVVASVTELQDFKQELVDLASSLKREPWEVHQCAKLAALTHKITFRETMELLLPNFIS